MKGIIIVFWFLTFTLAGESQTVRGIVHGVQGSQQEILVGATVVLLGSTEGVITDESGEFEIPFSPNMILVTSYLGYRPDSTSINEPGYTTILLQSTQTPLDEALITANKPMAHTSSIDPIRTEVITQKELTKAACCDLAGCFETQATVLPQTTNVITNSKELKILGLSGVYNQILFDGMPLIQGLSSTYGISTFPGTLVENIYVAKGANSVLQGFESISGQINVEPKMPDQTDKLFLNAYVNNFLEKHFNLNYASLLGNEKKWSTLIALHTILPANKIDGDNDNFLDLPLLSRYMLYNRWKYGNEQEKGIFSHIGLRFLYEQRIGGQEQFNPDTDKGSHSVYGQTVKYTQPEIYTKSGFRFNDEHAVTLIASFFHQNQNAYFGTVKYDATQVNLYANLQHEILWNQQHMLKYGLSFRYEDLDENILFTENSLDRSYAGSYNLKQIIPGAFVENAFHWQNDKIVWILGARLDNHQQFGSFLTPRTLVKYSLNDNNILRASIGTGWRQVHLFSENINLLASSRDILFIEEILPERALNWGVNYTYRYYQENLEGTLSADFYQTRFSNQFFPDYDTDPLKAYIKNFTGVSISNAFQIEGTLMLNDVIEIKAAYNYLDVYRIEEDEKNILPFNPSNRVMGTFSYRPTNNKWFVDLNAHWYDKQRLPNTQSNPEEFQNPDYSNPYTVVNAQLTVNIAKFEIYSGVENIFDFRQLKPITSWQDPFGQYFDTSSVWGPTRGRELYMGVRWRI